MQSATTPQKATSEVIDAMRSIQTESDLWNLADLLRLAIPEGQTGFVEIITRASDAGVDAGLSGSTLRAYRDTAKKWPKSRRIANVSFSAHREAERLIGKDGGPVTPAADLLTAMVKQHGAGKVTVAMVRKSVRAAQGKTKKPKASTAAAPSAKVSNVLVDLKAGAPELIAALTAATPDLDQIHKGLNKALTHVDRLRAKRAQKQTSTSAPVAATDKVTTSVKTPAPSTKTRRPGDLRRPPTSPKGK